MHVDSCGSVCVAPGAAGSGRRGFPLHRWHINCGGGSSAACGGPGSGSISAALDDAAQPSGSSSVAQLYAYMALTPALTAQPLRLFQRQQRPPSFPACSSSSSMLDPVNSWTGILQQQQQRFVSAVTSDSTAAVFRSSSCQSPDSRWVLALSTWTSLSLSAATAAAADQLLVGALAVAAHPVSWL